jgi:hypothetical protein
MTPISLNRLPNSQFSPCSRTRIVERYNCGATPTEIAVGYDLAVSLIRYTIEQSVVRNNNGTLPRVARRRAYNYLEERNILRYARWHPKATYTQLKREVGVVCSVSTIKRVLKAHNIVN